MVISASARDSWPPPGVSRLSLLTHARWLREQSPPPSFFPLSQLDERETLCLFLAYMFASLRQRYMGESASRSAQRAPRKQGCS